MGHTLAYNKVVACNLFKSAGIATPKFIAIYDIKDLDNHKIKFPVLIKPVMRAPAEVFMKTVLPLICNH